MFRSNWLVLAAGLMLAGSVGARAGEITLRGSDATLGVMKALAETYEKETGRVVKVEGGGGGAGIKAVQAAEVQAAFLTRPLKDSEKQTGLVDVAYAFDAVAFIVNKANATDSVTAEQLQKLYAGQTEQWSDGKPVVLLGRNKEANVRDVIQEKVMGKTEFSEKVAVKHAAVMSPTVEKLPGAIGYVSAGDVDEAKVKALAINGVKPTADAIRGKSYLVTLTPSFATKGQPAGDTKAFIDWVLSAKGQQIVAAQKLVPLGGEARTASAEAGAEARPGK